MVEEVMEEGEEAMEEVGETMEEGEEEVMVVGEGRRKLGGAGSVERVGAIVMMAPRTIPGVAPHPPAPVAMGGGRREASRRILPTRWRIIP